MFGTLGTDIAVVLFVHAVETDKLKVVGSKATGKVVFQLFLNRTVQIIAALFQGFVAGQRRLGQLGSWVGCGSSH